MLKIKATGSIIISADRKTVFDFISNLENDKFWRKEINSTIMTSLPKLYALATENSYLSKRAPNHILNLICTEFIENSQIVYETVPESDFFLKSFRTTETVSENETKVIYSIEFDKSIVKKGLGFNLPAFIIELVANTDMKKYLKKLKSVIETNKK